MHLGLTNDHSPQTIPHNSEDLYATIAVFILQSTYCRYFHHDKQSLSKVTSKLIIATEYSHYLRCKSVSTPIVDGANCVFFLLDALGLEIKYK